MEDFLQMILTAWVIFYVILIVLGVFLLKGERFTMYQEATGKTIEVKRGFSFTYMFFGPFVPLFRGHIGGFFLTLFIEAFSLGFARWILLFCYNGMYINWLAKNGFRRTDIEAPNRGPAPINIQINQGGVQPETVVNPEPAVSKQSAPEPVSQKKAESKFPKLPLGGKKEKYQKADSVIAPVTGSPYAAGDDGETVALKQGALIGVSGMYQGAEIPMNSEESITIGRDAESSNLVISDKAVSRQHCSVTYDAFRQTYSVMDHSTNGVYLRDGSRLVQGQPATLHPGDTIRIGNTDHVFQLK